MIGALLALQHGDTAFPSGSFAFSQGLEGLAPLEGKPDAARVAAFLSGLIAGRWAGTDRVALIRSHRVTGDLSAVAEVDAELEAASLVEPLRTGSRRNGAALLAVHARLGTAGAAEYRALVLKMDPGFRGGNDESEGRADHSERPCAFAHLPVVQGLVWQATGIDEAAAVAMSGYGLVSGIALAAVRLGLIGALDAQAIVASVLPLIADRAAELVADDQSFAGFAIHAEVAAFRQARAATRLFSN
ncbi:MAG: urease accessory protein UreF [Bauldia sp.]|nr:urease accessory protein UreF [Bauldia sp.]